MGSLAGPIEFSTGEIILLLVMFTAAVLFVPTVAGIIGVYRYRKRTPKDLRTRKQAALVFLRWAGAAGLLGLAIGYLSDFISSRF